MPTAIETAVEVLDDAQAASEPANPHLNAFVLSGAGAVR
jgi:hypothetical protein